MLADLRRVVHKGMRFSLHWQLPALPTQCSGSSQCPGYKLGAGSFLEGLSLQDRSFVDHLIKMDS